jgi:AcrR family transcriptional regulator
MGAADEGPRRGPGRPGRPATGVREALLRAAVELLAESGASRLTTREVAKRAGVAESSVFYHFGDRAGLLLAVVGEHLPSVQDLFAAERGGPPGSLRDDLVALLDGLEGFFLRVAPILAALQSDGQVRAAFAERSRHADIGPHRAIEGAAHLLSAEQRAGRIAAGADLRAAAMLLVGAAYQRAVHRMLGVEGHERWLATPQQTIDMLVHGLAAGPEDAARDRRRGVDPGV